MTESMSEDERAIRRLIATWMEASKAGDVDTVLALMTDDVVFMVPGQEPFGKAAFAQASAAMKDLRIDGKSEIKELEICGDWAWLRDYLDLTVTPPESPAVRRSGYALTILKKGADGKWRLARDANLLTVR